MKKRYVGSASNLDKRVSEHNSGKSKFTSSGLPWILVYSETFDTNSQARKREAFLKSGVGRKYLDEVLTAH